MSWYLIVVLICILKNVYLFLERGEGREKEGERNTEVREKHWSLPLVCLWPATEPTMWALALTGNQTSDLSLCGEPHWSGLICVFLIINGVGHLFIYMLAICMSSLKKCLFNFFAHLSHWSWQWFFGYNTKAQATKTKIYTYGYIKVKSFCTAKETIRMKRALQREEIFANHVSDKGWISKMYKEVLQLNSTNTNNSAHFLLFKEVQSYTKVY